MSRTVRTTLRPWAEIEIGDAEYLDLQRQGLIAEDPSTSTTATTAAPERATTAVNTAKED